VIPKLQGAEKYIYCHLTTFSLSVVFGASEAGSKVYSIDRYSVGTVVMYIKRMLDADFYSLSSICEKNPKPLSRGIVKKGSAGPWLGSQQYFQMRPRARAL